MFVPATFEKMLADKKVPGEKKDEIRALMPLVSISWVYYFLVCFVSLLIPPSVLAKQLMLKTILLRLNLRRRTFFIEWFCFPLFTVSFMKSCLILM